MGRRIRGSAALTLAIALASACGDAPREDRSLRAASAARPVPTIPVVSAEPIVDGQRTMRELLAEIVRLSAESNEYTGEGPARPYRKFAAEGTYAKAPAIEVRNPRTLAS